MCQCNCRHENRAGDCKIPYRKGQTLPCEMTDEELEAAEDAAIEAAGEKWEEQQLLKREGII